MRSFRVRVLLAAPVAISLSLLAGCNNDSGPAGPDQAIVAQSEEDVAESLSDNAVEILGSMIDAASGVSQPSPLRGQSVNWNGTTGSWTITGDQSYDDPVATGTVTYTITVQFQSSGTPQQYQDDTTDQVDVTTTGTNTGNYHPQDRPFDVDYDFQLSAALHAVKSGTAITVTGGGSLTGNTDTHIADATVSQSRSASWNYDLGVDTTVPNACADGTFDGTAGAFSFDGTLADGTANWDIYRAGIFVRSVTATYSCGGANSGL